MNLDVIAGVIDGLGEGSDDLSGEGEGGGEAVGHQEARRPGVGGGRWRDGAREGNKIIRE